ncbi:YybH family protein [Vreelandella zhaodongensis]|uniref:SgcJ/EcaC family oxidoreductase n=1 Tax=Vreelandella zhaodongensis TaxID=1176240 RepID=A0ABX2SN76_VREZH|nr:SgcJ/EcaC family oxidoreductase [Halomonas zhaodongensis]NYS43441.1 SgcJ/EcaC family oxidoreductase [Halomonas zhaodongensis]
MDADQKAIETLLMTQLQGFADRDAASMSDIYTEDADWTNAFGRTITGRDAIISYLGELFADSHFSDNSMAGQPEISVRTVGEDAVAVKVYTQIEGQRTIEGNVLPTRHNYSLKLLGRQSDGSWKIVSELFMDARSEVTHIKNE